MRFQNSFIGGMDKDSSKNRYGNTKYYSAENFRLTTDSGLASGTIENIKGNSLIFTLPTSYYLCGHGFIRDTLIMFLTTNNSATPTTTSNDCVVRIDTATLDASTTNINIDISDYYHNGTSTYHKVYGTENLGFCTGNYIQVEGRYESADIQKVYWADSYNNYRFLNIVNSDSNDLENLDSTMLEVIPESQLTKPDITEVIAGSLQNGKVQYGYQLAELNGAATPISPMSNLIHLAPHTETATSSELYIGGDIEDNSGKGVKLTIDLENSSFDILRLIRVFYSSLAAEPEIRVVTEIDLSGDEEELIISDTGQEIDSMSLEEFRVLQTFLFAPEDIQTKDNVVITGGITEDPFIVEDYAVMLHIGHDFEETVIDNESDDSIGASVEGTDTNPSYYNYASPYVHSLKLGYQREENYRFGIVLHDKRGRDSFVMAITDYVFPSISIDKSNIDDMDGQIITYDNPIATDKTMRMLHATACVFIHKRIAGELSGYSIVRVERGSDDRTVLAQGLLMPCQTPAGVASSPTEDAYTSGIAVANEVMYEFWSPEVSYNKNLGLVTGDYFRLVGAYIQSETGPPVRNYTVQTGTEGTNNQVYVKMTSAANGYVDAATVASRTVTYTGGTNARAGSTTSIILPVGMIVDGLDLAGGNDTATLNITYMPMTTLTLTTIGPISLDNLDSYDPSTGEITWDDAVTIAEFGSENIKIHEWTLTITYLGTVPAVAGDPFIQEIGITDSRLLTSSEDGVYGPYTIGAYSHSHRVVQVADIAYVGTSLVSELDFAPSITWDGMAVTGDYWLANYKRERPNQYGGNTEEAKALNTFIGTGVTEEVDIPAWGEHGNVHYSTGFFVATISGTADNGDYATITVEAADWKDPATYGDVLYVVNTPNGYGDGRYYIHADNGSTTYDIWLPDYAVAGSGEVLIPMLDEDRMEVWGGDTYIAYHEVNRLIFNDDLDPMETPVAGESWQEILMFPVETSINTNLSHGAAIRRDTATYNYLMKENAGLYEDNAGNTYRQEEDMYIYNSVYSRDQNAKIYIAEPVNFQQITEYDVRVHASNVKTNNETLDNWTQFPVNQYIEVDAKYGPIRALENISDQILFFQDRGFGILSINERALVSTDGPGELVLGESGVLDRYDYISTTTGILDKDHIVKSDYGLYWIDQNNKAMFSYKGKQEELSMIKGMNAWFKNRIQSNSTIKGFYDREHKEVLFYITSTISGIVTSAENLGGYPWAIRIHIDGENVTGSMDSQELTVTDSLSGTTTGTTPYDINTTNEISIIATSPTAQIRVVGDEVTIDTTYLLVYNELLDSFMGFYSFKPLDAVYYDNSFYSSYDRRTFYRHGDGNYGSFYGSTYDSKVTPLINPNGSVVNLFNNMEFLTEVTSTTGQDLASTFTYLKAYNSYQDTGLVSLTSGTNIRQRTRKWRHTLERAVYDEQGYALTERDARLKDSYLVVDLIYDNTSDRRLVSQELVTSFIPSKDSR